MKFKFLFCLIAIIISPVFGAYGYHLKGSWRGNLNLGKTELPIRFNFSETTTGDTECTLDSPAQGAKGIPATIVYCAADSIVVECSMIGARYTGIIRENLIEGDFSQRGLSLPLNLEPEQPLEARRPQTPKPPFPYSVIDTLFQAPDGAVLSATLTLPKDIEKGNIPAVVMVSGSGPQNRDEELFEHRPFAVIADFLARNGVASLRYDDRGTGKSTGDFLKGTTYTFKDDAESGLNFLRSFPNIGKTGIIGHSEGGTIAFLLAAEHKPDFIISLAGMALSGKETLMLQNSHALEQSGITGEEKENCLKLIDLVFDMMTEQNLKDDTNPIDIKAVADSKGLAVPSQLIQSMQATQQARTPWFDTFISLKPRKYISLIECPFLAINGTKDMQVDSALNLALIKEENPAAKIKEMPDLNHLMQHATTGEVNEYNQIIETISEEVLSLILNFINSING